MRHFLRQLEAILNGEGFETNTAQKARLMKTDRPIVVFGAGAAGADCLEKLLDWNSMSDIVFCDNYKRGTKGGTEIISFETLTTDDRYSDSLIVVAIGARSSSEVHSQLQGCGISPDRIIHRDYICDKVDVDYVRANAESLETFYGRLGDDLSRRVFWKKVANALFCKIDMDSVYEAGAIQYMAPCVHFGDAEVFVDGGAYVGDTILEFISRTSGRYEHIFAFEPDVENRAKIKENLSSYRNITLVDKGLWDRETTLRFQSGVGRASRISAVGDAEIPVTCIDSLLDTGHIPTFIKMDIEGSELMALRGTAHTIKEYKPKLAISIYHKPTDIVELPALIGELNSSYTYYLRHYEPGFSWAETVLYAV
jgi:FkbM family methyltransferase